ncbi:MAG: methyltransferase [Bacteroidales bacterium]|nr:methyltransferase [Bacteroidales bacterium]
MKNTDQRPFHFKQFSLHHHRSTMKVGTDAVLLGIWTELSNVKTVLDVGSGSGILSLLLASRAALHIDAVELDEDSCQEASRNFAEAKFTSELKVLHSDFNSFAQIAEKKYDLIISNPPFFINNQRSEKESRRQARHTDTLTYEQLISGAMRLLSPEGKISVVLPYRESRIFIRQATDVGLFLQKQMLIFPKIGLEPNRINLLFSSKESVLTTEKFIIRNENGSFSQQYRDFVGDFYQSIG